MGLKTYPPQQRLDLFGKVKKLGEATEFEASESPLERQDFPFRCWIYPSVGKGRCIPILKLLLSDDCQNNCFYCALRADRGSPRLSLSPEEIFSAFSELYRRGLIEGIFLSSSVFESPRKTMDKLIQAAEAIRFKGGFQGYIHLKIMPGAELSQVEKGAELANRISVNLEAVSPQHLKRISPSKDMVKDILPQLQHARDFIQRAGKGKTLTTQFVVGASHETDREILSLSYQLYKEYSLARCYFSAFKPIPGTPFENLSPSPKVRETRLYQADMLIRNYGFLPQELIYDSAGDLAHDQDPKLKWALQHRETFPIEVNQAEREELMRVPGIGPFSSSKIVQMRRKCKIKSTTDLKILGVNVKRASPFIILAGKKTKDTETQGQLL